MYGPSTRALDIVGVFDASMNQIAEGARPIKATIKEEARLMDHPIESGATITDHRVIMPVEIELSLMLSDPANDYAQFKALYQTAEFVSVQTATDVYRSMVIAAMPHDETPEVYDRAPLALSLREVVVVEAQFQALPPKQVASKRNASTVKQGTKQTTAEGSNGGTSSAAKRMSDFFGATTAGSGL